MRVRRALITLAGTGSLPRLIGDVNLTDSSNPNVVDLAPVGGFQSVQHENQYSYHAWIKFYQPYYNPIFVISHFHHQVGPTGISPIAGSALSTLYAIDNSVSWDPTTLDWNNEPSPQAGALSIQFYSNAVLAIGPTVQQLNGQSLLDCTSLNPKGIIVGLFAKTVITPALVGLSGSLSIPSITQGDGSYGFELLDTGTNPHKFLSVISRSSSQAPDVRTLVFNQDHHLSPGAVLISIQNVDSRYNSPNSGSVVLATPTSSSITYVAPLGTPSFTEASIASGGAVELYATGY